LLQKYSLNDLVELDVKGDFKVKEQEFDVDYEQKRKEPLQSFAYL
jgi:hypothetical protein